MSIDTVNDLTPRVQYVASAAQTTFSYTFPIFAEADLVVDVDGTTKTLTTDYTVTGVGEDAGGTVVFGSVLVGGEIVTVYRDVTIERTTDFSQNGVFSSTTFNDELDRLTLAQQDLRQQIRRCLRLPMTSEATDAETEFTPISTWLDKFVYIDANGVPAPTPGTTSVALTEALLLSTLYPQASRWAGTATGTVDAIVLTPSSALSTYTAGAALRFLSSGANTGATTVAVSGLAAKSVTKNGATALASGDIPSGAVVTIIYDGTRFQLANVAASLSGAVAATTLSASSTVSGTGFTNYFASPPALGTTAPAGGRFTFAHTAPVAVTFHATAMTVDCALSNVFTTTFTANVTTAPTVSNAKDGQTINWFITQDGTGSRTMTWPTSFKWPGGTAGVLSTPASSVDLLTATYRSSTGFWYCSLTKAFS